jgi:hypothetical protein
MVVGLCAGLVLVEVILQVAAWVIWNNDQVAAAERSDTQSVALCIGDSFTYGLGASTRDRSYPARAQEIVASREPQAITFVNRGVPGQTSRDVLGRLPGALQRYQPDLVYVLIGSNDYSFRPTSLDLAEDSTVDSAFPVRWRTRRLILLLVDWLQSPDSDKSAPFVGVWHSDVVDVTFSASGNLQFGDQRFTWSVDDDGLLQLQMLDGQTVPIHWRLEGARLHIESPAWTQAFLLEPGPLPGPPSDVLQNHLR